MSSAASCEVSKAPGSSDRFCWVSGFPACLTGAGVSLEDATLWGNTDLFEPCAGQSRGFVPLCWLVEGTQRKSELWLNYRVAVAVPSRTGYPDLSKTSKVPGVSAAN